MAAPEHGDEPRPNEPPPRSEPDLSGTTLDRYRLLRRIGVGDLGTVYEAEHAQLRDRFALEVLRDELAHDERFLRRFLREARAASLIDHPHVASILDLGETPNGRAFIVMELLEGRDLGRVLEAEGPLPWPRAREILLQATSALEAAHRRGVIHRDIKPSNCFLVDVPGRPGEPFVKLLGFGTAKLSESPEQTATQAVYGTVAYMAPEVAKGTTDDHRSDIYSLGVMMYQMLVGKLPFTEGNPFQILSQHMGARPPRPRDEQPSIPEGVEAIILAAIAKDPDERFSSMHEFGRALRRGSLELADVSAGVQTTRLHIGSGERPPGDATRVREETLQQPSVVTSSSNATSAPGSGSGVVPQRLELTLVLEPLTGSPSDAGVVQQQLVPTVVTRTTTVERPPAASMPVPPVPPPEPRRRVWPWVAVSLASMAAAAGLTAAVLLIGRDAGEDAASQAQQVRTEARERVSLEPAASSPPERLELAPEPSPSRAGVAWAREAAPEPTEEFADEPIVATPEPEPRPRRPRAVEPKPMSDDKVVAALRREILAECKGSGDTMVRIEGVISSTGRPSSTLITPATGPGACAKRIVEAASFDSKQGVRPMPRFSVAL